MIDVKLSAFEGPLDLLLHLIEKAEMDIQDIFVSEITSQYLLYMKQVDSLDMDLTSEFLSMAATLIYIKSRALLPRPLPVVEDEEDVEEALIRQLREYKLFKEASNQLETMSREAAHIYTRLPEEFPVPATVIDLQDIDATMLLQALEKMLEKENKVIPAQIFRKVQADVYTIERSTKRIRTILSEKKSMLFSELFEVGEKMEVIVILMTVLEMLSNEEIQINQSRAFGTIEIEARGEG